MNATETSNLEDAGKRWHAHFAKAFITQVSEGGEVGQPSTDIYIKVKFKTIGEMHEAYDAMSKLADLTRPHSKGGE